MKIMQTVLKLFRIVCCVIFIFFAKNSFANDFNIVAKVNSEIITKYDLDEFNKILKEFYGYKNVKISQKEVLDDLIDEKLKVEAIKNEKITFNEQEFKYYLENLKISNGSLKNKNYNNFLKNNYLWNKLIITKIKPGITVNNSEINDALEYLSEDSIRTRYNVSQIIIKNMNSNSKEIVNKLYDEINEKNNFGLIADKFSQTGFKDKGYIGWIDEKDMNLDFYNVVKNLKVNEISKPIFFNNNSSGYYLIVKLNDKKQEKVIKENDAIRIKNFLFNKKLELEVKKYMDGLYNTAFIEIN